MRTALSCLLLVAACAICAVGQNVAPTPTPIPTRSDDNDVVKISTNLIQIDVSAADKSGKTVTDLKPEEVEIYENGKKQKITNFSFISSVKTTVEKPNPVDKNAVNAPPVPQAVLRPDQIRRTVALVVDDLSLSVESAYQTRRALKKFVDEQMQDGDLVAIIRTGAGIGALQQFTSDKRILYAAIEKVKWNPSGTGGLSAFAPIEPPLPGATPEDSGDSGDEPAQKDGAKALDDFRSAVFATGTLGALKYIVTGMGELPGRKSVILFSDGFKLFETDDMGFKESGRVMDFLKELVETANRSSVVFYTVDARGLAYTGFTAADNISDTSPDAMNKQLSDRRDQLLDTQEGLSYLAQETGGFDIKNNNDLSGGVRRVLDDQSYYLVAYEPDSETFDPLKRKFNKLEVKVLRKGVNVRYRSGFFNVVDGPVAKAKPVLSPQAELQTALVSPFAVGGINLRLNALFGSDPKGGAFVRSLLHIDTSDMKFTDEKDGTKKAVFEVLAMSFGDNGNPVDQIGKTYTLTGIKPEDYKRLVESGILYHVTLPVKRPGAYQYRVAVRDVQGGKIGSASQFIEVPDLKKNRLTASSIVLETYTADEWRRATDPTAGRVPTNPMADTALRRVKMGSVLRYGYEIYNAKLSGSKQVGVQIKVRIFRDGKLILDGQQGPVDMRGQIDMEHLKAGGAIALGDKLTPGDYILQIVVTDPLAKAKQQLATQFVQFEIVE